VKLPVAGGAGLYGPNPCECLDLARGFRLTILGNHDQGALFDPAGRATVRRRTW
jgi:hypothetical protein